MTPRDSRSRVRLRREPGEVTVTGLVGVVAHGTSRRRVDEARAVQPANATETGTAAPNDSARVVQSPPWAAVAGTAEPGGSVQWARHRPEGTGRAAARG